MTKINVLKIATLTLLSVSTLFGEEIAKKVAQTEETTKAITPVTIEKKQTPVAEKIVEPAPAVEKIVESAPVVEKIVEPAPVAEKIVEPAPVVEKIVEPAPVVEKTFVTAPPKVTKSEVRIMMPQIPAVPKVNAVVPKLILLDDKGNIITKDSMEEYYPRKEKHIFSNRVAPDRFNASVNNKKVEILAGDIDSGRVTAYLHTELMSVDEVTKKLESVGFKVLSTFKVDKKGKVTSIVFTNEEMKKTANKKLRGFAATLRITVDTKNKLVSISNPIYLMRAFMQKEYVKESAITTLKKLRTAFPNAKNSKEIVKFRVLERFHFMENMPYYQDMKLVSEGTNEELLARAKKSKKVVYEQHLKNGSIVIGVKLGKRTSKFVKKIGYQNGGILPYPVLIEDGKAMIMAPQYYIAVMYPMLKMSKFMKIATIPGAIGKDIDRVFR